MHAFARRLHGGHDGGSDAHTVSEKPTKGLILDGGWGYDAMLAAMDATLFRGGLRAMRRRTIALAGIKPGERVLDVGCGTGTLALEALRFVGAAGLVVGVDPSAVQIARARAKAGRRDSRAEFQTGVIEHLDFPDTSFDVVLSTIMMHHLPVSLKRQGLAEIARVLKPGGRLVIADFTRPKDRQGLATRIHAGGSDADALAALAREAGFAGVKMEEMAPPRFSAFPGAGLLVARKGEG